MNSILKSIRPKWVAKILNGEKTIEVSKTAPKDWADYLSGKTDKKPEPKTVYIYCTKEDDLLRLSQVERDMFITGKNFDANDYCRIHYYRRPSAYNGKGKVVAKFTLSEVEEIYLRQDTTNPFASDYYDLATSKLSHSELLDKSCLYSRDLDHYLGGDYGYAWHISDLVIFDKPRELTEFMPPKWDKCGNGLYQCNKCPYGDKANVRCRRKPLTRAPQSWSYCEERHPGATARKIEL